MRLLELLSLTETSSAGSTASGNVATSVSAFKSGGIGPGFDPNGDYGIYPRPKRKKSPETKAIVIKR
jgi:hypothetical protein